MNIWNLLSRRDVLTRMGGGFGALALANVLADAGLLSAAPEKAANPLAPRAPHFPAKAKRLIFLFMNGGPSHVDTFDPKPELTKHDGKSLPDSITAKSGRKNSGKLMKSPFKTMKVGQSGIEISANCIPNSAPASTTCASCARCTPTIPITSRGCC